MEFKSFEFSFKMDLTIQMKIFNNKKHCQTICLKLEDRLFTLLTVSGCKAKTSTCSVIIENVILHCRKFLHLLLTKINTS